MIDKLLLKILAGALALAAILWLVQSRAYWKRAYSNLASEVTVVLPAIREASGNPRLQWRPGQHDETAVAEQIKLIGKAKAQWQDTATEQSRRIAELGTETERLKKLSDAERVKAERAIAERNTALAKLERMELTPDERATCQQQLKDAQAALDLAFGEGV